MKYNENRKGWETKDGGLIRIHDTGDGKIRVDIYDGDERLKDSHTRDTIHHDSNSGKGRIDSHNEDKSEKSSTGIDCYLTTACMKNYSNNFDDKCYELETLRWFRDNFVLQSDIEHYYKTAPVIIEGIEKSANKDIVYQYIYDNVISYCVSAIEQGDFVLAYRRYMNSVLCFEETFAKNELEKKFVKVLKIARN